MWSVIVICSIFVVNLAPCDSKRVMSEAEREALRQRMLNYASLPGVLPDREPSNLPVLSYDEEVIKSLPESFDPRDKWPNCPSLNEIRDQGQCGACWALSTVSSMTDRVCTYSNGTKHFHFSAEDMLTCTEADGCHGGWPELAFQYWIQQGIVSGGNYGSNEGCKPYSIPECPHHMTNCTHYEDTPPCTQTCREGYDTPYLKDRKHGKNVYRLSSEQDMMADLYTNGPFAVCFEVYEDFANYTGGVYRHVNGAMKSGHAVKLMGWGVEDGEKYWLIANSWGTDFGEDGYFKMLRGTDECRIESCQSVAGEPLLGDY